MLLKLFTVMCASTQTKNISANGGILNSLHFIEETKEEQSSRIELNIKYCKDVDESYEEDIYDSFYDRIDILADKYIKNYDSQLKYTTHIGMGDFHRGKSSNAKKKSKRSVSCYHIPDAHDRQEEQNAYYDVMFSGDCIIYY